MEFSMYVFSNVCLSFSIVIQYLIENLSFFQSGGGEDQNIRQSAADV